MYKLLVKGYVNCFSRFQIWLSFRGGAGGAYEHAGSYLCHLNSARSEHDRSSFTQRGRAKKCHDRCIGRHRFAPEGGERNNWWWMDGRTALKRMNLCWTCAAQCPNRNESWSWRDPARWHTHRDYIGDWTAHSDVRGAIHHRCGFPCPIRPDNGPQVRCCHKFFFFKKTANQRWTHHTYYLAS